MASTARLSDELRAGILLFFSLLNERQRRLYAGLEAAKLGYGGDKQIAASQIVAAAMAAVPVSGKNCCKKTGGSLRPDHRRGPLSDRDQ